jgi:hypothetical protein
MVLYVTSFNKFLYEATGKNLLESFVLHKTDGNLLIAHEDELDIPKHKKFIFHDLDEDSYLQDWLEKNKNIIPSELGGTHEGGFDHKYHKRTSQWFRKIAALRHAINLGYEKIVFLDCDVIFLQHLPKEKINEVFDNHSVFYHLGPYRKSKRTGIESGIIGFDMTKDGKKILKRVFEKYEDGSFKDYLRWDDAWMFTAVVEESPDVKTKDIVSEKNADSHVVKDGELSLYLKHFKGIHWRKYGVNFE